MLIATLAIAGIPPFAGFFSKDEILDQRVRAPATTASGWSAWSARVLTAFYMFRLYILDVPRAVAADATRPSTTCTSRRRR